MVQQAQDEKAPLVRLADRYSAVFTAVRWSSPRSRTSTPSTVLRTDGLRAVLSVLVVATPCPLILATPIALLGGVNAAARKKIIVKSLASLETLSRIDTIIFDKTGTITLGRPRVAEMVNLRTAQMPRSWASSRRSSAAPCTHWRRRWWRTPASMAAGRPTPRRPRGDRPGDQRDGGRPRATR